MDPEKADEGAATEEEGAAAGGGEGGGGGGGGELAEMLRMNEVENEVGRCKLDPILKVTGFKL